MANRRHTAGKGSVSEFRSVLREIAAELPVVAEALVEETARRIGSNAVERSTGLYQGDNPFGLEVRAVADEHGVGAGIYADWYWYFGEFGTTRQAARPYLVPALMEEYAKIHPEAKAAFARLPSIRKGPGL